MEEQKKKTMKLKKTSDVWNDFEKLKDGYKCK